ncbi:MAG TPA: ribosome-associated translation inhibitor RaiA [Burkholderiales bacterium]|jgi:ribosomal subunit interface protein|nr:ribosome-associated translation inhibitor RaiA [Burkholderiales bacterium]
MQTPVQITFRDIPRSEALEAHIRQKAGKLEEFHSRITSCRVTVEELSKHHHQGRQFRVRIDVRVPGKEIVANRDHHEDVYVALRDAFDAVKRQLEDAAREMRGDVKAHALARHGKVTRLFPDEGYGFIETADGRELYFSRDNVVHPAFEQLAPGMGVQFIEDMAAEGPQAKRVSVGKHHA